MTGDLRAEQAELPDFRRRGLAPHAEVTEPFNLVVRWEFRFRGIRRVTQARTASPSGPLGGVVPPSSFPWIRRRPRCVSFSVVLIEAVLFMQVIALKNLWHSELLGLDGFRATNRFPKNKSMRPRHMLAITAGIVLRTGCEIYGRVVFSEDMILERQPATVVAWPRNAR